MKRHERLGVTLSRAHHSFMAFLDAELDACGLAPMVRPGMGHVLYQLIAEDDLTLTELSVRARVAQSTITGVVKQMEKVGLAERRPHERDGRAARVRLTAKARALRPRLEDLDRRCDRAYAAALSAREVVALTRLLDRLRAALTREPLASPRSRRQRASVVPT